MKVLLIGGTGIISSEVCNRSVKLGYEVAVLNRGRRTEFFNPKATFIKADIRNNSIEELESTVGNTQFDVVVDFLTYNVEQLKKMLFVFSPHCTQYIFVSSATAYSDCDDIITEDVPLKNDKWKYATDKAECETYLRSHALEYGIEYTIIRPYITYNETRIPYQIAPTEYYTIINRIKNHKPLPIYGDNVRCTLTSSGDFAVAAVGLFLNDKAYGEAFHITSDCVRSWRSVGELLGKELGESVSFVQIPYEVLSMGSKFLGFSADEILGDKGRNMIFDNSKIKAVIPEFDNFIQIEEGIKDTITHYECHKEKCRVNYEWDGRIDNVISSVDTSNLNPKVLSVRMYSEHLTINNKLTYIFSRHNLLWCLLKGIRKIRLIVTHAFCLK